MLKDESYWPEKQVDCPGSCGAAQCGGQGRPLGAGPVTGQGAALLTGVLGIDQQSIVAQQQEVVASVSGDIDDQAFPRFGSTVF